jgi:hypothetical protein
VAISKANFNSFNVTPTASKFITFNSSNDGLAADDIGGSLVLISTSTASNSANLSITSGIDSTYKEYIFKFHNIHPVTDGADFTMNFSVDGGSNYNVTKTSTIFQSYQGEGGENPTLNYDDSRDLAQSTGYQVIMQDPGNANEESGSGTLHLFDPSNTALVKHFISDIHEHQGSDYAVRKFLAGYANTTSAIDAVDFKFASGNIDSGVIKLYGVN